MVCVSHKAGRDAVRGHNNGVCITQGYTWYRERSQ